jgi:peptide/nickel transport system substrate-binding protein
MQIRPFILSTLFVAFLACATKELPNKNAPGDPYPMPADAMTVPIHGERGGKIITATVSEPDTFNPIVAYESDAQAFNQITGAGLTRLNLKTQQPEPALAKSWEVSANQLEWTFHLRQQLKWSDGAPFTADDVLFTMQIVNDPQIPSGAQDVLNIDGKPIRWSKIDDYTIHATLPSAYAPLLRLLDGGTAPIIPKHQWKQSYGAGKFQEAMQLNMRPKDFICMGAFRLKEYKPGERVTFVRNPHYWKKDESGTRLPYVDEITFLILPGQDQLFLRLQNGELDTYQNIRPQDVDALSQYAATIKLKLYPLGPSYQNEQFFFNQNGNLEPIKRSWFQDVKFRRAVSSAIDRTSIARNAYFGKATPVYGAESPSNTLWYSQSIETYPYNPEKALTLLHASGFYERKDSDGNRRLYDRSNHPVRFSLYTNAGNNARNTQCSLIVSDLAKLGMQVDYTSLDFGTIVDKVTKTYDFDSMLLSMTHDDVDPAASMHIWLSRGTLHFWNPNQKAPSTLWEKRIDQLMGLQIGTYDYQKRRQYYEEVQKILAEQQPIIFTVNPNLHACAKESLANVQPVVGKHRTLWNADELYWKRN